MYTDKNFKTKKEVKEALGKGVTIRIYQPNDMFGVTEKISSGRHEVSLEGPHYPEPHKWYGRGTVVDGLLVGVK